MSRGSSVETPGEIRAFVRVSVAVFKLVGSILYSSRFVTRYRGRTCSGEGHPSGCYSKPAEIKVSIALKVDISGRIQSCLEEHRKRGSVSSQTGIDLLMATNSFAWITTLHLCLKLENIRVSTHNDRQYLFWKANSAV